MGRVFKDLAAKMQAKQGGVVASPPTAPAGPSKAPKSASWLLAKHRHDQGLGPAPADDAPVAAPAPAAGGLGAAPAGGIVDDAEERRRRLSGVQL